jgi:hypothetical protein
MLNARHNELGHRAMRTRERRTGAARRQVAMLLDRHGRTFSEEIGIDLSDNTPTALFRWLCATILFSTRISATLAMEGATALATHGLTTPEKMRKATWEERTRILNRAGYARYDESTSRELAAAAGLLLDLYDGDLRKLRDKAQHDPSTEWQLLQEFKGIGPVGADIFCREVQLTWDELFPFADKKALAAAKALRLGSNAANLADLVERRDFPRFLSALVRCTLAHDFEAVKKAATQPH